MIKPPQGYGISRKSHQPDECSLKPFFRWGQAQGRSPDMHGIPPNAPSPIGVPLKRAPQSPSNKSSSSEKGWSLWPLEVKCHSGILDMTLNYIRWWGSSSWALGRFRRIPSLPLFPGPLWPGMAVPVRVPSMCQINLLKNNSYSIGSWATLEKKKNCPQTLK